MGFRFRKSAKVGPFRINFSKSGVGYSFGGKGFRVTKKAGGGMRTTASIPGSGISYVKDYGKGRKTSRKSQATTTSTPARDLPSVPTRPMSPTMFRVMHALTLAICVILALCAVVVADRQAPGPSVVLVVIALLFLRSFLKMPGRQQASIEYWEAFDAGVLPSDSTEDSDLTHFDDTEPPAKKPFYKRPWFVALVIILLLGILGNACSSDNAEHSDTQDTQQEETVVPGADTSAQEETQEQQSEPVNQETPDSQETATENEPTASEETQPQAPPTQSATPSEEDNTQQQDTPAVAPVTPPASTQETQPAAQPEPDPAPQTNTNGRTVYITKTGSKYHYDSNCGNGTYYESTLSAAEGMGLTPCAKCAGG